MSFPLIVPPFTPMHPDGQLNLDPLKGQAEYYQQTGVAKVFLAGSTGESHSLTVEERMQLAEKWVEIAPAHDLGVIVHVGHNCMADAQRMAAHAQEIGAESIAVSAPCLFKPATTEALIDFCAPIASEAPDLPFYYYHIPALTNVRLPMVKFLQEAPARIPQLAGIKYTDTTLAEFLECACLDNGAFNIWFGYDEGLMAGYVMGAKGAVGSTYNFAAALYHRIVAAVDRGDFETARAEQVKASQMINTLITYTFQPSAKYVMALLGIDCGPVRPPYPNLTDNQKAHLKERLEEQGLFEAWKVKS